MEKSRKIWVDMFKVIAIFLIVVSHVPFGAQCINQFVFLFHVAAFFFISGYLENKTSMSFGEYLKVNAICLLVPYFIWNFIEYFEIVRVVHATPVEMLNIILGVSTVNPPSWFLPVLFALKVSNYLYASDRYWFVVASAFLLLAAIVFALFDSFPFYLNYCILFSVFYVSGFKLKTKIDAGVAYLQQNRALTGIVAVCLLAVLLLMFNFLPVPHGTAFVNADFLAYWVCGSIGIMMLLAVSVLLDKADFGFVKTLSVGTLFIMCTHFKPAIMGSNVILKHVNGALGDVAIFIYCLVLMVIYVLVLPWVYKYVPILAGRRKKKQ